MATLDSMGLVDRMNDPEIVPLPIFSKSQVMEFVDTMLRERECEFENQVPENVAKHLAAPFHFSCKWQLRTFFEYGDKYNNRSPAEMWRTFSTV